MLIGREKVCDYNTNQVNLGLGQEVIKKMRSILGQINHTRPTHKVDFVSVCLFVIVILRFFTKLFTTEELKRCGLHNVY